jgi:hypothetical protein
VTVLTDQARNIEAIGRYISEQEPARTAAAVAVRDEWQRFASALGDWEANYEQQAYDRARNIRLKFNRANAVTPAERAAVEQQAIGGVSTEEVEGDPDRRTSSGAYIPPPSPSAELARTLAIVGAGVGLLLLWKVTR